MQSCVHLKGNNIIDLQNFWTDGSQKPNHNIMILVLITVKFLAVGKYQNDDDNNIMCQKFCDNNYYVTISLTV